MKNQRLTLAFAWIVCSFAGIALAQSGATVPNTGAPVGWGTPMMGGMPVGMALIDRIEGGWGDEDTYVWDAQGWYGSDWNKLWLKTEGEGVQGESPEEAELQVLYARLFSPFFYWQAGVRHDFRPAAERDFFVASVQGLVPYMFEVDVGFFVSEHGDASVRFEAEYDLRLTQRLIAQPRFELNAAFSDVGEVDIASGLNSTELGVRLRYEFRREFAPYIGVNWTQLHGDTADIRKASGGDDTNVSFVIGLRAWF